MRVVVNDQLRQFLTVSPSEEALDQPLYHIQTYGTGGATTFSFFGTTYAAATNGLADTNLPTANAISQGQRFAVYSLGVAMLGGQTSIKYAASATVPATPQIDDLRSALEGIGAFQFSILAKAYYDCAPLAYLPAGFGVFSGAGGVHYTQASGADGTLVLAQGSNGVPTVENQRRLRVPIPIPGQVTFSATAKYPSVVTIGTASRLGVYLGGILIRPRQ